MFSKIPFPFNLILNISIFLGIIFLFNYKSAIYELAELYKTDSRYAEEVAQKGKPCRYRISKDSTGSMTGIKGAKTAFLEAGIYIDSIFIHFPIFDSISPKLLIPWQEISGYEVIEGKKYSFYLGSPTITILTLSIEEVRELENLSGILISDRLDFA